MLSLISLLICCLLLCASASGCSNADTTGSDASTEDASTKDASTTDVSNSDAADVSETVMLVDHELWSPVAAADDPFGDPPDQVDCEPAAWGTENLGDELTFFVKTQGCNYLTVAQPTLSAIKSGETINIRLWHYDLTAPAASEAHLGLHIGDHLAWEANVPIPTDSELLVDTWTAPADIPAGQDISFHVHNHGNNEYNLVEVSIPR
jgi:hypothetical protein